jgi:hypothetical protein
VTKILNKAGFIKGDKVVVKAKNKIAKVIDTTEETVLIEMYVPSTEKIIDVSKLIQQWYTNEAIEKLRFKLL